MKPYYEDESVTLFHGDCRSVLPYLPDCSIDSIVCDPPYELGFMGKGWDRSGIAYDVTVWRECLRILKPGAHLLAFGGSRTYHRLACAIEDAGFEIRDQIQWLYGSGFPKSLNIQQAINKAERGCPQGTSDPLSPNHGKFKGGCSDENPSGRGFGAGAGAFMAEHSEGRGNDEGEWNGWGTALKPAHEPIVLARKPLIGTVAQNILEHGTGGLNIDGCRIATDEDRSRRPGQGSDENYRLVNRGEISISDPLGRWPANVIHDASEEVLAGFPTTAPSQQLNCVQSIREKQNSKGAERERTRVNEGYLDSGSAARFFKSLSFQEDEVLFHRAKAIMYAWNSDLALTVDNHSSLSNQHADSVLRRAAIAASHGAKLLSGWTELSTSATPMELKRLGESLITAILFTERNASLAPPLERPIDNGCLVRIAEAQRQTGIITITISHWRSNGSVDPVTLTLTSLNLEVGAKDSNASRFTYCAKADNLDRNYGLEDMPKRATSVGDERASGQMNQRLHGVENRKTLTAANHHPTVKPTELMRYLCRLITPPGGLVLDPFCGSGSTGKAAMLEGLRFVGIELSAEYCELAQRRIEVVTKQGLLFT